MGDLPLISLAATLLLANGQTTERTTLQVERLAAALGHQLTVVVRWGELILRFVAPDGTVHNEIVAVSPTGVDMHKVAATIGVLDDVSAHRTDAAAALSALHDIARLSPVSLARFATLAGAGAAALGVIFGSSHPLTLLLIAVSAGAGGCVRRWLSHISSNPFVQPLCAALVAGIIGAIATRLQLSSALRLIAVCPCMVLVPGPHLLNGAIDLVRARIALGAARLVFATMIILVICIGLLGGLAAGGESLPVSGVSSSVPFGYDVIAAGVAVAAYGTFFSMPWSKLPIPIAIGMAAHATRWAAITLCGAGVATGALVACLLVGIVVTPIADRLRMPFAAFAFASVVSLIPGVYLFRMASGLVSVASLGNQAPPDVLLAAIADGTSAMLIMMAITFGLIVPKLCIEAFHPARP
jgi:uncharacterized membrane protein YjjP (DUF1212 family)